jgi:hypothetical protein
VATTAWDRDDDAGAGVVSGDGAGLPGAAGLPAGGADGTVTAGVVVTCGNVTVTVALGST